ncbi:MAG TPA: chemotaxis protein CheW [Syntrophomonadaceae bacterium]|nr:chemotaxis protein CheW [Syntrophomonadaceae bacterium]HRX20751.1 chemotaxis protein CheW [Syntrophomonadaceae bacterium]
MTEVMDRMMETDEDTLKGKFLTFFVGREEYAIEIKYVTEIIGGIQTITEVPEVPDYIRGIINLRGKIIPVMDVNMRFKKEPKPYGDRTCITVIDIDELSVGLIVDDVAEVLSIPEENIDDPPDTKAGFNNRYIKGIGKVGNTIKLILDCKVLLSDEDLESFADES